MIATGASNLKSSFYFPVVTEWKRGEAPTVPGGDVCLLRVSDSCACLITSMLGANHDARTAPLCEYRYWDMPRVSCRFYLSKQISDADKLDNARSTTRTKQPKAWNGAALEARKQLTQSSARTGHLIQLRAKCKSRMHVPLREN